MCVLWISLSLKIEHMKFQIRLLRKQVTLFKLELYLSEKCLHGYNMYNGDDH